MAGSDQFPEKPRAWSPGRNIQPSAARLGLLAAAEWHRTCATIWTRAGNNDKHEFHLGSAATLTRMSMCPAPKTGGTYLPDAAFQVRIHDPKAYPNIHGLYLGQMRVGTIGLIGGRWIASVTALFPNDRHESSHDTAEAALAHLIQRVKEFIGAIQIDPAPQ